MEVSQVKQNELYIKAGAQNYEECRLQMVWPTLLSLSMKQYLEVNSYYLLKCKLVNVKTRNSERLCSTILKSLKTFKIQHRSTLLLF